MLSHLSSSLSICVTPRVPCVSPCRVPILGVVPRSQLQLCLKMELVSDASAPRGQSPAGSTGAQDDSGDASSLLDKLSLGPSERADEEAELSRLASLPVADGNEDLALEEEVDVPGVMVCLQRAELREGEEHQGLPPDSSEPSGSGKVPNRDSGIDSPSCTVEGEVFPNEDAIDEEDRYDSVTETETSVSCCVTLGNKRDSTQDEDSDLDEGSCGEAEGAEKTDALSEAHRVRTHERRAEPPGVVRWNAPSGTGVHFNLSCVAIGPFM